MAVLDMSRFVFAFSSKTPKLGFKFKSCNRLTNITSVRNRCLYTGYSVELASSTWLSNNSTLVEQRRRFLPGLPNPFGSGKGKKLVYAEEVVLGYSMEQMFEIVSRVDRYPLFVPWCKETKITERFENGFKCRLTAGFPPIVERYSSVVTLSKPHLVKSECFDGMLFNSLVAIWKFDRGLEERLDTCTLNLRVEFEFLSSLHSQLAQMFFDEVVRTMVSAFLKRAKKLYGPPSIKSQMKKNTISSSPSRQGDS